MPKKGKYYHLEQAMDALTNDQLGHDKYKHYQDTMKRIKGNFDKSILYDCINECLVIKLKIGELSEDIKNWKVTTTDIATKLNKLESISDNIKEINTSKIELGIEIHNVKRKINTIKNKLTSDVKELEKKLKEKENEIKEEKERAQEKESQEQQGVSSSSDQSPVKETGAVPKRKIRPPQDIRRQIQKATLSKTQEGEQGKVEDENTVTIRDLIKIRETFGKGVSQHLTSKTGLTVETLYGLSDINKSYPLDSFNQFIEKRCEQYSQAKEERLPQKEYIQKLQLNEKINSIICMSIDFLVDHFNKINKINTKVNLNKELRDSISDQYKDNPSLFLQLNNIDVYKIPRFYQTGLSIIVLYYTASIFHKLLNNDCIDINLKKVKTYQLRDFCSCFFNLNDKRDCTTWSCNEIQEKLTEYGFTIPHFEIPDINNQEEMLIILRSLYKKFNAFLEKHLPTFDNNTDNSMEKHKLFKEAMKENGYKEKVDEVVKKLSKQYQQKYPPSPSHEVEEASLQGGACAQTER